MSEVARKRLGCCSVCDCAIAPVITKHVNHPLFGNDPRRIGKPFDYAVRATLILSDGKTMDITACSDCDESLSKSLVLVWKKVLLAFKFEMDPEILAANRSKPYTEAQLKDQAAWVEKLLKVIPLGVLYRKSWKDVK